ncbi:hypothetical protein ACMBCN_02695, partial [Candidatus Liberibacter asiaticus]|nr:hypothetical protein [Candidatus Liberibacter asiaticus]
TNVINLLHFFTSSMEISFISFTLEITSTMEKLLEEKHSTKKKNTQRDTLEVSSLTMVKNPVLFPLLKFKHTLFS